MFHFLISENIIHDSQSILKKAYNKGMIEFYYSGSSSQYINGSVQKTKPEYAFDQMDKNYDWCSNCGKSKEDHPYIIFNIKNHKMRLNGYYLKSGCCTTDDGCCCQEENYICCECCLYSWSLQISNDNTTWKTVHKVEKDNEMRRCREKTFKFSETYTSKFVKLLHDESCNGDPPCFAINKIEFSGEVIPDDSSFDFDNVETDEDDVSIIGHISKKV